jgi:hypothetical protein
MRLEVGGAPEEDPAGYVERSPLAFVRQLAFSGVPLQIWWSRRDEMVVDQRQHSGLVYRRIEQLNPSAPISQVVGAWKHGESMRWNTRLPEALGFLGLAPDGGGAGIP